jgi:hypothetical protein
MGYGGPHHHVIHPFVAWASAENATLRPPEGKRRAKRPLPSEKTVHRSEPAPEMNPSEDGGCPPSWTPWIEYIRDEIVRQWIPYVRPNGGSRE